MTDRDTLRMRFRIANPVPDPDTIDTEEFDRMLMAIEFEWDQVRGLATPSAAPRKVRRSRLVPALVFGAAVLLVLLAVGLPVLFLGGAEEQPPVEEPTTVPVTTATTVPPTTVPTTVAVDPTTTIAAPQAALAPPMTWERIPHQSIFEDATMWTLVAGGPGLVAGGWIGDLWGGGPSQGAVFVSADGVEWERIEDPSFGGGITDLAVGPDSTMIALGCGGETQPILVSQNGRDWDPSNSDLFGPGCRVGAQSVTAGGPGFVAVGNTVSDDAAVWLSEDGRDWIQVSDEAFIATKEDDWRLRLSGVVEGGPGLVAIGGVGIGSETEFDAMGVWVSEDGTAWERLPNLNSSWAGGISRDPETGRLFAVGNDIWMSDDGLEWTRNGDPRNQPTDAAFAWDGERVVAGGPGSTNPSLWASGDRGRTWSRIDPSNPVFGGYRPWIWDLTRFGDTFVAVGEAGEYAQEVAAIWIGTWDE